MTWDSSEPHPYFPRTARFGRSFTQWRIVFLVGFWLAAQAQDAVAQQPTQPTQADIAAIRGRVTVARRATNQALALAHSDRRALLGQLDRVDQALVAYERLAKRAADQRQNQSLFWMAGTVTLADDASGVGMADDVLLPVIALAALAHHLLTQPAVTDAALARAWQAVLTSLMAAGNAARDRAVKSVATETLDTAPPPPPPDLCRTAIKILTQYERLASKFGLNLPPSRLAELDRLRDAGQITINHIPGTLRGQFPGGIFGEMTLSAIRARCGL